MNRNRLRLAVAIAACGLFGGLSASAAPSPHASFSEIQSTPSPSSMRGPAGLRLAQTDGSDAEIFAPSIPSPEAEPAEPAFNLGNVVVDEETGQVFMPSKGWIDAQKFMDYYYSRSAESAEPIDPQQLQKIQEILAQQ